MRKPFGSSAIAVCFQIIELIRYSTSSVTTWCLFYFLSSWLYNYTWGVDGLMWAICNAFIRKYVFITKFFLEEKKRLRNNNLMQNDNTCLLLSQLCRLVRPDQLSLRVKSTYMKTACWNSESAWWWNLRPTGLHPKALFQKYAPNLTLAQLCLSYLNYQPYLHIHLHKALFTSFKWIAQSDVSRCVRHICLHESIHYCLDGEEKQKQQGITAFTRQTQLKHKLLSDI